MNKQEIDKLFESLKSDLDKANNKLQLESSNLKTQTEFSEIKKPKTYLLTQIYSILKDKSYNYPYNEQIKFQISNDELKSLIRKSFNKLSHFDGVINLPINKESVDLLKSVLDFILNEDLKIQENNEILIIENCRLKVALFALFKRIGLSSSFYGVPSNSRKHDKKWIDYNYISEISNQIPTSTKSRHDLTEICNNYKSKLDFILVEETKRLNRIENERQNELRIKQEQRDQIILQTKYKLSLDSSWEHIYNYLNTCELTDDILKDKEIIEKYWNEDLE